MSTNLKPHREASGKFTWTFDLEGIEEMYKSYEEEDLWPLVERRPQGLDLNFVKVQCGPRWDDALTRTEARYYA